MKAKEASDAAEEKVLESMDNLRVAHLEPDKTEAQRSRTEESTSPTSSLIDCS